MSAPTPYGEAGPLLAAALGGGETALRELAGRADLRGLVLSSRVGPALALRAAAAGVAGREVEAWHRELMATTSHGLLIRRSLASIAAVLGREGVAWAPIKGLGLSPHVYAGWEERPTGDIDVLIAAAELDRARAVLRAAGWADAATGEAEEDEAFLQDEGYNWKALDRTGVALELHFGLWGCAPEGLGASVLERATPDPELGTTARRLLLEDAWVIGAVHWWTTLTPRPFLYLWDLHRIAAAAGPRLEADVLAHVCRWGLQLFAAPVAAAVTGLWGDPTHRSVAAHGATGLRPPERMALARIERAGVEHARLEIVSLARLLAGRSSRMGWKAAWRRVWPHPAVLRQKTPAGWSWARRRAWFAAYRLGLVRRAG